jgi:hypothetical protein
MPIVDPDPAGIGTYLVAAVLLALGIAIFLSHLIGEARANRGQERDRLEAAAETGAPPGLSSAFCVALSVERDGWAGSAWRRVRSGAHSSAQCAARFIISTT